MNVVVNDGFPKVSPGFRCHSYDSEDDSLAALTAVGQHVMGGLTLVMGIEMA